jgi:hypothetical protein
MGIRDARGGTRQMGIRELWSVSLWTVVALGVFLGLFYFKRVLRSRLFPTKGEGEIGGAMTELLLLQARLEERASLRDQGSPEVSDPESPAPLPRGGPSEA